MDDSTGTGLSRVRGLSIAPPSSQRVIHEDRPVTRGEQLPLNLSCKRPTSNAFYSLWVPYLEFIEEVAYTASQELERNGILSVFRHIFTSLKAAISGIMPVRQTLFSTLCANVPIRAGWRVRVRVPKATYQGLKPNRAHLLTACNPRQVFYQDIVIIFAS